MSLILSFQVRYLRTFLLSIIRDPELVKKIGAATAREVRATGIPYVFAPCIAVNSFVVLIYTKFVNS